MLKTFAAAVAILAARPVTAEVAIAIGPPAGWVQAVDRIGDAIQVGDVAGLGSHAGADPAVYSLTGAARTPAGVVAAAMRTTPLLRRAYVFPSMAMASDLAAAAAESDIPDPVARALVLKTPDESTRADDTARRWVERLLPVGEGDLVAVFVYVPETPAPGAGSLPVFVLMRGVATDRGYMITHIAFGSP